MEDHCNDLKCGIVHFRNTSSKKSEVVFTLGGSIIETVSRYKYLGVILDEHLTFKECARTLVEAGGRALSKIIGFYYY